MLPCVPKPLKRRDAGRYLANDLEEIAQRAHFAETARGKLAIFTAINLITSVSSAKVHRCAVAISLVSPWCFFCFSPGTGAVRKKGTER